MNTLKAITFRVTAKEKERLEAESRNAKLSMSRYLSLLLSSDLVASNNEHFILCEDRNLLRKENQSFKTKILNLEVENAKLSSMLEMMEKEKEALALKLTNAPPAHSYQEVKKKYLDFRSENIDLRNSLEEQKKAFEQEKIKLLETLEEQKKVLSVKNRNIKSRKKTPFKKLLSRKRSKTNSENKVEL